VSLREKIKQLESTLEQIAEEEYDLEAADDTLDAAKGRLKRALDTLGKLYLDLDEATKAPAKAGALMNRAKQVYAEVRVDAAVHDGAAINIGDMVQRDLGRRMAHELLASIEVSKSKRFDADRLQYVYRAQLYVFTEAELREYTEAALAEGRIARERWQDKLVARVDGIDVENVEKRALADIDRHFDRFMNDAAAVRKMLDDADAKIMRGAVAGAPPWLREVAKDKWLYDYQAAPPKLKDNKELFRRATAEKKARAQQLPYPNKPAFRNRGQA
jgi:hypothetical protein